MKVENNDTLTQLFIVDYDWTLPISEKYYNDNKIHLPIIEETSVIITVFGNEEASQDFVIKLLYNILPLSDDSNINNETITKCQWPFPNKQQESSKKLELKLQFVNAHQDFIKNDFIFFKACKQTSLNERDKEILINYFKENNSLCLINKELVSNSDLTVFVNVNIHSISLKEDISSKVIRINTNENQISIEKDSTYGYNIYNLRTELSTSDNSSVLNDLRNQFHKIKQNKKKNSFSYLNINKSSCSNDDLYEWLINYLPLNEMNIDYNIAINVDKLKVDLICEFPGCNNEDVKLFKVKECIIVSEGKVLYFELDIMGHYLIDKVNLGSWFGNESSYKLLNAKFEKYKNGFIIFIFELNKD